MRDRLRVVGFVALVVAGLAGLSAAGHGVLAGPSSIGTLPSWLQGRDPLIASFALLRLGALGLGWYVLAVTVLGGTFRALRAYRLAGVLDAVTFPGIRRLLNASAGLVVVIGTSLPAGAAGAAWATPAPTVSPPVMHWLGPLGPVGAAPRSPIAPSPASPPTEVSPASPTPTAPDAAPPVAAPGSSRPGAPLAPGRKGPARPLGSGVRPLGPEPGRTTAGPEPGRAPAAASSARTTSTATWTVQPGDDFWHIAEATLVAARHRPVTDAEIAPYWLALIEANRNRLAAPSEPSFIYPGQVFVLPPVPLVSPG